MSNLVKVVQQLRIDRNQAQKRIEPVGRSLEGADWRQTWAWRHKIASCAGIGKTKSHVGGSPKENRYRSACPLGEMEGCQEGVRGRATRTDPARE